MRLSFRYTGIALGMMLMPVLALGAINPVDISGSAPAAGCVKAKLVGVATTYNPGVKGWKTGSGTLATGGAYNPNDYTAALQLDLAKQYRCGYGSGKCHAVVEGNGKAMIVLINDNGPMCADPATARAAKDCKTRTSRVIDLNEKSMRYMSNGTMGNNSGTIPNVTVTLVCDMNNMVGPLNEKERSAWASRTFGMTASNLDSGNLLTQATNGSPNMWQSLGQPLLGNSQPSSGSVPSSYSTTPSSGYSSAGYTSGYGTTQTGSSYTTGTSAGTTPVSTALSGSTGQTSAGGGNTAQSLLDAVNGKVSSTTNANTNTNTNTNTNYTDTYANPVSSDLLTTHSQLAGSSVNPASTTLGTSVAIGSSQPTTFGESYGSVDTSNQGSDLSSVDQSGNGDSSASDSSKQSGVAGVASDTVANIRAILAKVVTILKNILATLAVKLMGGN